MSSTDTPDKGVPPLSDQELALVDGVLKDMTEGESEPVISVTAAPDVGTPPAMFGAGGPM